MDCIPSLVGAVPLDCDFIAIITRHLPVILGAAGLEEEGLGFDDIERRRNWRDNS